MDSHEEIKLLDSEPFISPLHEALRGTTAMLVIGSALQNQPIVLTPQEPTNISMNDSLIYPYQVTEPASLPSLYKYTTATSEEPNISSPFPSKFSASSSSNNHNAFLSVSDSLSVSEPMRIKSMDPPPLTSLVEGNPLAVLHAHFNTIDEVDLGPNFEQPTQVPCGLPMPTSEVSGTYGNVMQRMSCSTAKTERGRHEYVCKICSKKYFSSQAYGGHMRHHKDKKKEVKSRA
ncbi:hypothetical protein BDA96_02G027100 [Sorghum bicolor]|uniref:C2H2-type domain-containing protein n=2 Tax=Sorghum bicolor TaxID=4558 RepID=A0A921RM26_SORBI|nr:hypothetical protein BDA96_02G027100 [Sorghum bicolor]OQU88402.1 hypothetical protein SORBI_3002G027100 [Sorghum bicolor]